MPPKRMALKTAAVIEVEAHARGAKGITGIIFIMVAVQAALSST